MIYVDLLFIYFKITPHATIFDPSGENAKQATPLITSPENMACLVKSSASQTLIGAFGPIYPVAT